MLSANDLTSLRRSHAMAPLSPAHVRDLLDACDQLLDERARIRAVLADLPTSFAAVRESLNRLHHLLEPDSADGGDAAAGTDAHRSGAGAWSRSSV